MSKFYANCLLTFNRFFCLKNATLFLLITILAMYSVHLGVKDYTISLYQEKEFQKTAELSFSTIMNYESYSVEGVDLLSLPAVSGVLFAHPAVLSNITANINTIVNLRIYNDCQSKAIFKAHLLFQLRLSAILLLLGSLLALFIGFDTFRDIENLKSQASASSDLSVYISIGLSRFLLLLFSFLSILLLALGMMAIKGIHLTQNDFTGLSGYFIASLVMLLFSFILGTVFGHIRSAGIGIAVLMASWIALVLIAPGIFDSIIEEKANEITPYSKVYKDKLTVVIDFEKRVLEKEGPVDKNRLEIFRNLAEDYLKKEYTEIEAFEEQHKEEINRVITLANNLYILLPSTFYLLTANEASSRGYRNYLEFYSYLQGLRRQFLRFWIDRVHYNDPKVMVNFVKGDENIFKAKSQLPPNFLQGVLINLGYCIALLFLSFYLFKRSLFPAVKKNESFKDIEMNFVPGQMTEIKIYHNEFISQFVNVFFGKIKGFDGKLSIDVETIVTSEKKDFIYLPPRDQIPGDMKGKTFLDFNRRILKPSDEVFQTITAGLDKSILNKTFEKLEPLDKARIILAVAQMKKSPVYIINNINSGLPEEDIKILQDIVQGLRTNETVIILFSTEKGPWIAVDAYKSIRFDGTKYFNLLK